MLVAAEHAGRGLVGRRQPHAGCWPPPSPAPALAVILYFALGSPGRADLPFEGPPEGLAGTPIPRPWRRRRWPAVLGRLTKERPNDPEGYRFLALAEGALGRSAGGRAARLKRAPAASRPSAPTSGEMLGEAEVFQSGGQVTQDAQGRLRRDPEARPEETSAAPLQTWPAPGSPRATRPAAWARWRTIVAELSPGDPRVPALQGRDRRRAEGAPARPAPRPASSGEPDDRHPGHGGRARRAAAGQAGRPRTAGCGWCGAYAVLGDGPKARRGAAGGERPATPPSRMCSIN